MTAEHHHSGLKRDAASVWIGDVTQSSFKVCLRELQNYAGSHEDISVASIRSKEFWRLYTALPINVVGSKLQAYATRPNSSVGRRRRPLHVPNTNEV